MQLANLQQLVAACGTAVFDSSWSTESTSARQLAIVLSAVGSGSTKAGTYEISCQGCK